MADKGLQERLASLKRLMYHCTGTINEKKNYMLGGEFKCFTEYKSFSFFFLEGIGVLSRADMVPCLL